MKAPFKLPATASGPVLIARDHELICRTEGASPEELAYLVRAINLHERLVFALAELRRNVDVSTIRPGKRVEARWIELIDAADVVLKEARA